MGSPAIFAGRRSKLLTADGILNSNGTKNDFDGLENFISNGHAEVDTTGWSTYADAAGTRPVDGTGGSPNSTWTRSTSSPINGQGQFLWTKSGAANRQGEGVAYTFSIPLEHRGKALSVKIPYIVTSGTFTAGSSSADSDLIIYFYDITNSKLVEASSVRLLSNSTTIVDLFQAQVQFDSTCTSARLIIHTATTSTSNYTVAFDDIYVGPSLYAYGTPVTDWVSYTPTGSWVSNTTYAGYWRRVGKDMEYRIRLTLTGAPTATSMTINYLPSGLAIDTSVLNSTATDGTQPVGLAVVKSAGTNYLGGIYYNGTSTVAVVVHNAASTYATYSTNVTATVPATFASGDSIEVFGKIPISGWSSCVQTSSTTDTRIVVAKMTISTATTITTSAAVIPFDAVSFDTHGGCTTGASAKYTCRVAGYYRVSGKFLSAASTVAQAMAFGVYKNTVATAANFAREDKDSTTSSRFSCSGSEIVQLNVGDYIDIRGSVGTTNTNLSGSSADNYVLIERISGPNQIAASETVACKAYSAANITGLAPNNSYVKVNLDSKDFDTHGGWSTSNKRYDIQSAGVYEISLRLIFASTNVLANIYSANIYKNGVLTEILETRTPAVTTQFTVGGTCLMRLNAGDYLEPYLYGAGNNSVSTLTATGDARYTVMSVRRVGI